MSFKNVDDILFKEYTEEDEIIQRKEEMLSIEQTLSEMLQTLNKMNQTVENTGEKLNQIQDVIITSRENVIKGENELQKAEKEESKLSWHYTTLGASVGVIAVITSPFDFGIGTLVSGMFIGGVTGWFMKKGT